MQGSLVDALSTDDIRHRIHSSFLRPQTAIYIVTPFLQDVDFGNNWSLQRLISRQLEESARLELLTRPPVVDRGSGRNEFRRKYRLLEGLERQGVHVRLNPHLHAKAFCFNHNDHVFATFVGSANMTGPGLHTHLEMALLASNLEVYRGVMAVIRQFQQHPQSVSLAEWRAQARLEIADAFRGVSDDN